MLNYFKNIYKELCNINAIGRSRLENINLLLKLKKANQKITLLESELQAISDIVDKVLKEQKWNIMLG